MPRSANNRGGRGGRGGGGGGRGFYRGRGGGGRGRARGRGRGSGLGFISFEDEYDFALDVRGNDYPRGRGRGRGTNTPRGRGLPSSSNQSNQNSGQATPSRGRGGPRGRGDFTPNNQRGGWTPNDRGGGRGGRGGGKRPINPFAPLSEQWYQERPLLRPITFVKSKLTPTLFMDEEEIFEPVVEAAGEEETSHVPTADRVFRVFHTEVPEDPDAEAEAEEDGNENELEEIDFEDMGKFQEKVEALAATSTSTTSISTAVPVPAATTTPTTTKEVSMVEENTCVAEVLERLSVKEPEASAIVVEHSEVTVVENAMAEEPMTVEKLGDDEVYIEEAMESGKVEREEPTERMDPQVERPVAEEQEQQFTGFYIDTTPTPVLGRQHSSERILVDRVESSAGALGQQQEQDQDDEVIVYVAPHPKVSEVAEMALAEEEEKKGKAVETDTTTTTATPLPPLNPLTMSFPTLASSLAASSTTETTLPSSSTALPSSSTGNTDRTTTTTTPHRPLRQFTSTTSSSSTLRTPRSLLKHHNPRSSKITRRAQERKAMFGTFGRIRASGGFGNYGALMDERRARKEGREVDPRRDEQRRGESDVDWGDDDDDDEDEEDDEDGGVMAVEGGIGELDIDDGHDEGAGEDGGMQVDEEVDLEAMKAFVRGMGAEGSRHVTMDELEDEERIRREDAEERTRGGRGSRGEEKEEDEDEDGDEMDEEMEKVLEAEERELIAEAVDAIDDIEEDSDKDSSDSDDDNPPSGSFQARLKRLRERSRGRPILDMLEEELDAENDDFEPGFKWESGDDEDLVAQVQEFLDENGEILAGRDKKQRNRIFRAVQNGEFDMDDAELWGLKPAKSKKDPNLPADLQDQWSRDRAKKADHKRARALAKLEAAADPLAKKKGGKKGRKAMLLAASLDPTISTIPNRITNLASVEAQIRRFLADIGGRGSMALPPMAKDARAAVHELATAFNLKSQSKGKGSGRYTTLTKTTRSGVGINEYKVRAILTRNGAQVSVMTKEFGGRRGAGAGGGKMGTMKPKEGEEVGKAAPRIDRGNIGFKMLAAMGWAEGDRVGVSGGLEVPLTAIVKTTKLGLGAEFDDRKGRK